MKAQIDRLRKVLALERRQGYRDQAVIGGMESLAERWGVELLAETKVTSSQQLIGGIVEKLRSYSCAQGIDDRKAIIEDILSTADSLDAGPPPQPVVRQQPAPQTPNRSTEETAEEPAEAQVVTSASASTAPEPGPRLANRAAPTIRTLRARSEQPSDLAGGLDAPVSRLPGVGPSHSEKLSRLGVTTVGDLLYLFPRRYDDYSQLKTIDRLEYDEDATVIGNVWDIQSRKGRRANVTIVDAIIGDATGTIQVTWFNPYITRQLKPGRTIVLSGKITERLGRLVMTSPAWEPLERELIHTGRLVPVYPLTEGISARWIRRLQKRAVDAWAKRLPDHLPTAVRERAGLLTLSRALEQVHFPDNQALLEAARRRLSFDEFFLIQVGALRSRREWQSHPSRPLSASEEHMRVFSDALPFQMTSAQERTLDQIRQDLSASKPMNRMLQGDVGSGKTAVAAAAMWSAICSGTQAAIMAPTEILAEQHYASLSGLFANLPHPQRGDAVRLALLVGSLSAAEKEAAQKAIAAGEVDIAIGTHALIQSAVEFSDLTLAVIDEQHRFGVRQRSELRQKGHQPHVLVMSATPIPRSLALTVYGDLDLSTIDELPPGRQAITTRWVRPWERERAYSFLRAQVKEGRQGFVVCPLVEESDAMDAKAAVTEYERLQGEVFPQLRLGLLHGRLKGEEKESTMRAFRDAELDILVSTSVVEVGIDVPNATVMLVEGAERFGLAQLHQFRGRVGRGEHQSHCLLLSEAGGDAAERLQALVDSQDGFVLAEKDLELRGPGDFFGTRQSGLPALKMAKLGDVRTIEMARAEAARLTEEDPDLLSPENRLLQSQLARFWRGVGDVS